MGLLNRQRLRELAETRLKDASIMFKGRRYGGAYYLCGYVIECALKACIAKHSKRGDFPDKTTVTESYTHSLTKLLRIADLQNRLDAASATDSALEQNWTVVKDWSEKSRYQKHTQQEAQALYMAVKDSSHGVFEWIRRYW